MTRSETERCGYCRYWQPTEITNDDDLNVLGDCRFNPPNADRLDPISGRRHTDRWPVTERTEWCGKFEPKENLVSGRVAAATQLSFLEFLKQREPSDDPKGDMAGDILADTELAEDEAAMRSPAQIRTHLRFKGAIPEALKAFDDLWEEYQDQLRRL